MTAVYKYHPVLVYFSVIWLLIVIVLLLINGGVFSSGLTTAQIAFWDLVIKAVGGLVAIIGATLAALKFLDEKSRSNQIALMEAQKPFFTKRQEVYYDLVGATSIIANKPADSADYISAQDDFWLMYWGVLPLVTDDEVGRATNAFEAIFCNDSLDREEMSISLRHASMELARACRKSLNFS